MVAEIFCLSSEQFYGILEANKKGNYRVITNESVFVWRAASWSEAETQLIVTTRIFRQCRWLTKYTVFDFWFDIICSNPWKGIRYTLVNRKREFPGHSVYTAENAVPLDMFKSFNIFICCYLKRSLLIIVVIANTYIVIKIHLQYLGMKMIIYPIVLSFIWNK